MNVTSLIWIVPYLVCGAFSHLFDDPLNHAVYVWLPSGIAVGAYLLTRRENWPLLLLGFFAAQAVITGIHRAELSTSFAFAFAASAANVLAAWSIQALKPRDGGPGLIAALFLGALIGAACSAAISGTWLWLSHGLHSWTQLRNWVAAYLAGVLILAPALKGWANFRARRSGGPRWRDLTLGLTAYLGMAASAFVTFDGEMLKNVPYVVSFELTYLPIVFSVLVALIWGPPGGTLAVATLTLMTLWQSAQGEGPFVDPDDQWHALIATQVYLIIAALLILLVNSLRSERAQKLETAEQWRVKVELALAGSRQLLYRYSPERDELDVSGDVTSALGTSATAISNLNQLLALTHPEDRNRLKLHWAGRRAGALDQTPLLFRLAHKTGGWRIINDRGNPLSNADGSVEIIAGTWRYGDIEHADAS